MPPKLFLCSYLLVLVDIISSYCLYTNLDVNSIPIPTGQREKAGCKRNVGAEVGCVQHFRCQQGSTANSFGYYVEGDRTGNGVQIECVRYRWVLSSDKATAPRCIKGCPVLTAKEMENSTFIGKPSETFRNGAQEFWPVQTVIKTACREGYIFKNIGHEANKQDQHRCTANQGWLDMINQKSFGWPAVCRAICDPFDIRDIPNNVIMVINATDMQNNVRDYNGRKVLVAGSTYKFQCAQGFNYGFPHNRIGYQVLICAGGKEFWYDSETGENSARPTSCLATGCPALSSRNTVSNSFFSYENNCVSNGGVVNDGCTATVQCNPKASTGNSVGYYMVSNPNGYAISCRSGKWMRPDGTEAKLDGSGRFGEFCSIGCNGLTEHELQSSKIIQETGQLYRNNQSTFYPLGSLVVTSCNDGFIRLNIINQNSNELTFLCENSGWINIDKTMNGNGNSHPASCVRGCELLIPPPAGTKMDVDSLVIKRNSVSYVVQNSSLTVTCEQNFQPPEHILSSSNIQRLRCVGGSQGWKSEDNGQLNSVPMICVKTGVLGCILVNANTHPNVEVRNNSNCSLRDGLYEVGCALSLRCTTGFVPSSIDESIDMLGVQELVCKAGTDGYTSKSGNLRNVTPMSCLASCDVVHEMITATYTKPPVNIVRYGGNDYLRSGEEVAIKCKTPDFDVNNYADLVSRENIVYKCFGGADKYLRLSSYRYNTTPGDACSGVCEELEGSQSIGTSLTRIHKTDSLVSIREGIRYAVNVQYYVQCSHGYEFPKGTLAYNLGHQRLYCSSLSDGYMDMDTNQLNAKLATCVRTTQPSCMELEQEKMKIVVQNTVNCSNTAKNIVGCTLTLSCRNGTYSTNTNSNTQQIICEADSNGQPHWASFNKKDEPILICANGCSKFPVNDDFTILPNSDHTIGNTEHYKEGSTVLIQCAAGRFPTLYSGVHRSDANQFTYVCMPTSFDGRNWRNVLSQRIEMFPGSLCGKACSALVVDGKGLDVVSRPEEFGISSRLVVGESYYELQCKPGHKYDSSVHDALGKQVLFCDPKSGSYLDLTNNNQTEALIEVCSMISDSGCPDLTVPHSVMTYSNCDNGYKNGCRVTISCDAGYIPVDVKHHNTGAQTLSCSNGSEWKGENGQEILQVIQCVAACRMDNTTIDANVLISRDTTRKYLVLGVTYILEGDSVFIKCRGDSVIWEHNIELTQQEHLFVCGGGPLGFIRNEDHMSTVKLGAGCVPTCPSLSTTNLGNLNLVVNIPTVVQFLGKSLVVNGLEYSFSCKENYMYPSGTSPSHTGLEKFRCDGASGKFINLVTNQVYDSPTACTRSTYLNECIKLISDESRVIQTIYQCYDAGDNFYRTGCSITSKCLPDYMPESSTYYIPSGEQKIICGDGGAGWRDQFGNIISEGFKCVPGCKPYENSHEYIRIHEKTFFINGLKIECKEIDVIKNQTSSHNHPYYCESNSSNNSTDKGCTNACKQIVTLPAGVEIFKNPEPKQLEEGYQYIAGNSEYVLRCQNGFTYESTSIHLSFGRQTLRCNPTTNQYDDVDTQVTNARIEPCVESKGCHIMTLPPNVLETVGNSGCTRAAGFFSNGCTIIYQCPPGFFPSDRYTLYFGSQTAQCSSSNQTWLDREGKPFTSIITCSHGCADLNLTELVTLQYESTEIFYETYSDLESDDFECYSRLMYTNLIEVIQQARRNSYICPKQNHSNQTHISGNQELFCKEACPVLLSGGLPEGVQFSKNPVVFNPYNQGTFLGMNKTVVLQCRTGYEYLPGSVYSSAQKQEFLCDPSLKYFDIQANSFNSVIQPCIQVAGAPAPLGSNVNQTADINCQESNGIYRVGCKLTVKCIQGAYPSNPLYFQLAEQNLELIMDPVVGIVWVDSITRTKVDYLSCSLGCLPLSIINLNITTTTAIARYGSVTARCQIKSEDLSIGLLPNGTARYFCELQGGETHVNTTSPCTNVCEIPNYDKTLTVRIVMPMAVPFSQYMVLSSPMSALCPPGKQWPALGLAQRGFVCSENNEVRDSLTNTIVRYITDTCL